MRKIGNSNVNLLEHYVQCGRMSIMMETRNEPGSEQKDKCEFVKHKTNRTTLKWIHIQEAIHNGWILAIVAHINSILESFLSKVMIILCLSYKCDVAILDIIYQN